MSLFNDFKIKYPQDNFFNLKRTEDISTIYHNEYVGNIDSENNYWCEAPIGFKIKCDYIMGIFGKDFGIAVGVLPNNNYRIIYKHPDSIPTQLKELGLSIDKEYSESEISNIISLI